MSHLEEKRTAARLRFLQREKNRLASRPLPTRALNEECGVFGIIGAEADVAPLIALGLHALQHRGQEAAGIITFDGERFHQEKASGLVSNHFMDEQVYGTLKGRAGIGHTRYSTTGGSGLRNVQPFYADLDRGGLAFAHNGNLTNARTLRADLIREGRIFHTTSDSEIFVKLIAQSRKLTIPDRIVDSLPAIEGAYALQTLSNDTLVGVRDPVGIRPLVLGKKGQMSVLSSETCALEMIGAEFVREVAPGEMVVCHQDGTVTSRQIFPARERARPCVFEMIYFSRPNSFIEGDCVHEIRKSLGRQLAIEAPVEADIVSPIPDGGIPGAMGYAQQTGHVYDMALIRGHYAGRTFIQPTQELRELGVNKKFSANKGVVEGKRVVLIDDSIVRGTTSRNLTRMLRNAGAKEVHFRIASPPIKWPDYYGIDLPSRKELLAANYSIEEIRQQVDADSLEFLSLEGLYTALGHGPRDEANPALTDHCFSGKYPTTLTDLDRQGHVAKVEQLSFLAESG